MQIEIEKLGQTLALGGASLLALNAMLRLLGRRPLQLPFQQAKSDSSLQHAPVFLALILAFGIVLENVSKSFVSDRDFPGLAGGAFTDRLLDTDKDMRLRSLFHVKKYGAETIVAKPRQILKELIEATSASGVGDEALQRLQKHFNDASELSVAGKDMVGQVKADINTVYYRAKNLVYRQDNYYSELRVIGARMEFLRSMSFLGFVSALATVLIFVLRCGWSVRRRSLPRSLFAHLFVSTAAFLATAVMCAVAYRVEGTNYNLRIFGYYSSLIDPSLQRSREPSHDSRDAPRGYDAKR
jgi:hypothetical protein